MVHVEIYSHLYRIFSNEFEPIKFKIDPRLVMQKYGRYNNEHYIFCIYFIFSYFDNEERE